MKIVRNLVGPQVRKVRYRLDLTQEDFAAKLQRAAWAVSRASLAKIEAQIRWVADAELYLATEVLREPMVDLFLQPGVVRVFVGSQSSSGTERLFSGKGFGRLSRRVWRHSILACAPFQKTLVSGAILIGYFPLTSWKLLRSVK